MITIFPDGKWEWGSCATELNGGFELPVPEWCDDDDADHFAQKPWLDVGISPVLYACLYYGLEQKQPEEE